MIRTAIAGLALVAWAMPAAAQDGAARFDTFQPRQALPAVVKQIAPDLHFFYDDLGSNAAWLTTDDGVFVIDTRQHPALARDLIERIRKTTDKPIKWVLNTHAHGDHFLGNPEFKKLGATIVAHRDTRAGMVTNADLELRRRQAFFRSMNFDPKEAVIVLPDITFDSRMVLRMGNRTADMFYLGAGQNPGDTFVHFPHARALFIGGPFARKNWSNMSFTPSVDGWIAILRKLAAYDVDTFLPGHGDIGNKQDVLDEADLLADVQAAVKKAMAEGKSRAEIEKLDFSKYATLRNYDRRAPFLAALHHLYTTGKPQFPYGEAQ